MNFGVWVGLALHATQIDKPEIQLNNPVGIVEMTYQHTERLQSFCKHESGLLTEERGYGFNECGLKLRLK